MIGRRDLLRAIGASAAISVAGNAHSLAPARIAFPRDHGAHPPLRTEWWYVTGRVLAGAREFGFQVTFFRSRVDVAQGLQSGFAAKQLVFAHAAITDVDGARLWHDQRIAREGFDIAEAAQGDTRLRLRDWSLVRSASGEYAAHVNGAEFAFDLKIVPTQPVLLQGREGLSRKGPRPDGLTCRDVGLDDGGQDFLLASSDWRKVSHGESKAQLLCGLDAAV